MGGDNIKSVIKSRFDNIDGFNFIKKLNKVTQSTFLGRIFFLSFPILLLCVLYFLVIEQNAFYTNPNTFLFLNDYSNSITLNLLLASYYICGYYPDYSENIISKICGDKSIDFFTKPMKVLNCLAFCFLPLGFLFIIFSMTNNENSWTNNINCVTFIYYIFIVSFTYYVTIVSGVRVLYISRKINHILYEKLYKTTELHNDNIFGFKKLLELCTLNIAVSFFILLCVIINIATDFVTQKNCGISNFFAAHPESSVVVIALCILGTIFTIIPLYDCKKTINDEKTKLINECNEKIKKLQSYNNSVKLLIKRKLQLCNNNEMSIQLKRRETLFRINTNLFKSTTRLFYLLSSITIPMIGVIIQTLILFQN